MMTPATDGRGSSVQADRTAGRRPRNHQRAAEVIELAGRGHASYARWEVPAPSEQWHGQQPETD